MKLLAQAGSQELEVTIEREDGHYRVVVDGKTHLIDAQKLNDDFYTILNDGRSYEVSVETKRDGYYVRHVASGQLVTLTDPGRRARVGFQSASGRKEILSVMPGKIVRILVQPGQVVESGQGLIVVEAMKMENEIAAPAGGQVKAVVVEDGQTVEAGEVLLIVE